MKKSLILFTLLILSQFSFAQGTNYVLKGKVLDENTRQPLIAAAIVIKGLPKGASADVNGYFELKIKEEHFDETIRVQLLGYDFLDMPIRQILDNNDTVSFYLPSKSFELEPAIVKGKVILRNIVFEFNAHKLLPESYGELNKVYNFMKNNPDVKVEISGHTDSIGTPKYNKALSMMRASAVVAWLEEKGIEQGRMIAEGYGDEHPISSNKTELGQQQNRRVEFTIMKDGKPVTEKVETNKLAGENTEKSPKPIEKEKEVIEKETSKTPIALFPKGKSKNTGVINRAKKKEESEQEEKKKKDKPTTKAAKIGKIETTINPILNDLVLAKDFNGVALLAKENEVLYQSGLGFANMTWSVPNKTDTKFRIGAITEQFTAFLVLDLVEKEKIKLDDPIINYLPDYNTTQGNSITVQHLLSHHSGLVSAKNINSRLELKENSYDHKTFINQFKGLPTVSVPGKTYLHSALNYYLLAVIIENVTGEDFETLLQEDILNPLGMTNTRFFEPQKIDKSRASGHYKENNEFFNSPLEGGSIVFGANNLLSTAADLQQWFSTFKTNEKVYSKFLTFIPHNKNNNGWFSNTNTGEWGCKGGDKGYEYLMINNQEYTILLLSNVESNDIETVYDKIIAGK